MIWHYDCPDCGQALNVDWDDREAAVTCPHCRQHHYPPTPNEDHLAYVGGDHWPPEIEQAVTALRGTTCEVPGCFHPCETLGLRRPASEGGRIAVDNLVPMCHHHARLKGEQDYDHWLNGLSPDERAGAGPEIQIEFTAEAPPPDESQPIPPPRLAARSSLQVLAARASVANHHPPDGLHFVAAVPVLAGSLSKVVLYYRCALAHPGGCRVTLAAWPSGRPPDWSRGLVESGALVAYGSHDCPEPGTVEGQLELDLSGIHDNALWTATVFLESDGGRPELTDYLLAGTT